MPRALVRMRTQSKVACEEYLQSFESQPWLFKIFRQHLGSVFIKSISCATIPDANTTSDNTVDGSISKVDALESSGDTSKERRGDVKSVGPGEMS